MQVVSVIRLAAAVAVVYWHWDCLGDWHCNMSPMESTASGTESESLSYCRFAIDETPVCVWSYDLNGDNRRYLNAIDPDYFEKTATIVAGDGFEGSDAQTRAVAIRALYGQASEALLALLAATAQAPDCVPGWMGRYQNRELDAVIAKISRGAPLLTRFSSNVVTWESLSAFVHAGIDSKDPDFRARCIAGFARFWRRLASEHGEPHTSREYNAIKHGLRTRAGGFSIAIGIEETPGKACPPEKMGPHWGSPFGTSTVAPIKVDGTKRHYCFGSVANNWNPSVLALRLSLIAYGIGNVIARLKLLAGEPPERLVLSYPGDVKAFDEAWPERPWPLTSTFSSKIDAEDIQQLSDADILEVYQPSGPASKPPGPTPSGPPESTPVSQRAGESR